MSLARRGAVALAASFGLATGPSAVAAEQEPDAAPSRALVTERIIVIGKRNTVPGAGVEIDAAELERFDHTDVHQVLAAVPGVYVREEDGYGLRPNVGIRGAAAERSQKVTLLEDGMLIAPAPYSAPAAYYMPNVNRVRSIEVLKGPSALHQGPHTVGGALNFVTRKPPDERLAELDASLGSDAYHKVAGVFGMPSPGGDGAFLVEGLRYASDGFKQLDGGGKTGFERNDIGLKWRWEPAGALQQRLSLAAGYADEDARETYLGLSDADFRAQPRRRYRASQLDRFDSSHFSAAASYDLDTTVALVNAKAYWRRFERAWNKLDGFLSGRSLQSVLASPQRFTREYDLLAGAADSQPVDAATLDVTNNDRSFISTGVQAAAVFDHPAPGGLESRLTLGLRLHHDAVERRHMPRGYLMTAGAMVWDGVARAPKVLNEGETTALAAHVSEELSFGAATLTLGLRYEDIAGELTDLRRGARSEGEQRVLTPGAGLHWQVTDELGLVAGAYRGFSPAGPGSGAEPEKSVNVEYGLRYRAAVARAELIGFFSDYDNLLGRCRVSDSGCEAGDEFNGGAVEVAGAELSAGLTLPLPNGLGFDAELVYTYTESAFQNSFLSGFSQWGLVRRGDELPYLPSHRGRVRLGVTAGAWEVAAALRLQEAMREEPGYQGVREGLHADGFAIVDLSATWRLRASTRVQLLLGNATDEVAIVSHRPFGARPNRPRWLSVGIRQTW